MALELIDSRFIDWTTGGLPPGSGGGGGGGGTSVYASRSAAQAASPTETVMLVKHGNRVLTYYKADPGIAFPALVTADSAKWSPADAGLSPLHWGAIGDGITDDHTAMQNMFNFMSVSSSSMSESWAGGYAFTCSGYGKTYAVSKPIMLGNQGTGAGYIYYANVTDMRVKAIQGSYDWTTIYSGEVPSYVFTIAFVLNEDANDTITGIYKVSFNRVHIDCSFITGGIYIQNTTQLSFRDVGIDFMAKNTSGFQTSVYAKTFNPRGYQTVNGALLVENMNVQGYVEESGIPLPSGEDQDTMNTCAFKIQTNDARYHQLICSRTTQSMYINYCGAIQFSDIHPWSKEVYIGPEARNMMFSNCYFDYTRVILHNSWKHRFIGCHWFLGGEDRSLELRTSIANEDARGLMLIGCTFIGFDYETTLRNIFHTTDGTSGAYWRGFRDRNYQLIGCVFGVDSPREADFAAGKYLTIDAQTGYSYFRRRADGFGRTEISGSTLSLGLDRFSGGLAGMYFQWSGGTGVTNNGSVYMTATGNLALENNYGTGDIVFGPLNNWGATRVKADGVLQVYGLTGVNAAASALRVGRGTLTRAINAGGTINASGADYAEYHELKEHLYGNVAKGAILGFASDGLLTDRFDDVKGRFVLKSTDPNLVGADSWGMEENLVKKYNIEPLGPQPEYRDVAAPKAEEGETDEAYEKRLTEFQYELEQALIFYNAELACWNEKRAALEVVLERERVRYDRIAKAGFVPVNIQATSADMGKYLVPAKTANGGISAILVDLAKAEDDAETLADLKAVQKMYRTSLGTVIGIAEDGRPLVEVKVG